MNVLLIHPPDKGCVKSYLSHLAGDEGIGFKPPLGLLYIATYIHAHTAHRVRIIDCQAERYSDEQIISSIAEFKPRVVGISTWTDFWYPVSRLVRMIKAHFPDIFIVLGGPHLLCYPAQTLAYNGVDAVIVGDGEWPMKRLLECLESGIQPNQIPGLHFKAHGVHAEVCYYEKDLDAIPIPDRTLLPIASYSSVLGGDQLLTTMITSRGCPFSCVFCKISSQRPVSHSAARVLDEFEQIYRLGIREVEIYDDTFTWSHQRVIDICKGLIEKEYSLKWSIRDRVSHVKIDTLEWMKKAGCTRIHYGIESGSNEVLKRVKKRITVEQAMEAIRAARGIGFQILCFYMIGLPGETLADIRQTIDFSLKLDADYSQYSITIPYPGTEMYLEGISKGIYKKDFWLEFVRNPTPDFIVPFAHFSRLSLRDMIRLRNEAHFRFYYRPRIILRELKKLKSMKEFSKKAQMALTIFKTVLTKRSRGSE